MLAATEALNRSCDTSRVQTLQVVTSLMCPFLYKNKGPCAAALRAHLLYQVHSQPTLQRMAVTQDWERPKPLCLELLSNTVHPWLAFFCFVRSGLSCWDLASSNQDATSGSELRKSHQNSALANQLQTLLPVCQQAANAQVTPERRQHQQMANLSITRYFPSHLWVSRVTHSASSHRALCYVHLPSGSHPDWRQADSLRYGVGGG